MGAQEDAAQFLEILWTKINFSSKNLAEKITIYETKDGSSIKYGSEGSPAFCELAEVHSDGEIDLQKALQGEASVEVRPDAVKDSDASWNTQPASKGNRLFTKKTLYKKLPEQMVVKIGRGYKDLKGREKKNDKPVLLNKKNLIELIEYEEIKDEEGRIVGAKQQKRCFYRIGASIKHLGEGGSGGHYICYTRDQKGDSLWDHNDRKVSKEGSAEQEAAKGYLLCLKKVREEAIEESLEGQEPAQ